MVSLWTHARSIQKDTWQQENHNSRKDPQSETQPLDLV